jgi:hypothetical protein
VPLAISVALVDEASWRGFWESLKFPDPLWPAFADIRSITNSPIAIATGLNPQIANPGDPWDRVMNYPLIWSDVAVFLGLQAEAKARLFGLLNLSVYCLAIYFVARETGRLAGLAAVLFLFCSSSSVIGMERGNIDLLLFYLIAVACSSKSMASIVLYVTAGLGKLFPLAALPIFAHDRNRFLIALLGGTLVVLVLLGEIADLAGGTPETHVVSYGAISVERYVDSIGFGAFAADVVFQGIFAAVAIVMFRRGAARSNGNGSPYDLGATATRLFLAGSSIFLATFVTTSNFDYRTVFLILATPFFLQKDLASFGAFMLLAAYSMNWYLLGSWFLPVPGQFIPYIPDMPPPALSHLAKSATFVFLSYHLGTVLGPFVRTELELAMNTIRRHLKNP